MATSIDSATLAVRSVVPYAVPPGWIWSRQGHELWMLHIDSRGIPCTQAVDIQSGAERTVTDRWGNFSPSGRFLFSLGTTAEAMRVSDLETFDSWDLAHLGVHVVTNRSESHVAAIVRTPGERPPFTFPADVVVATVDGSDRQLLGQVLGTIAGWRADNSVLVIGRDHLAATSTLRVMGLDGTLRVEWALGRRVRSAQVSPDGRHMTFAVILDDPHRNGLFVIDLFTGHQRQLPSNMNTRWLPDGSGLLALALSRREGKSFQIWRVAFPQLYIEGPLTDPDRHDINIESMDWQVSPSGNALAFRTAREARLQILTWERGRQHDSP